MLLVLIFVAIVSTTFADQKEQHKNHHNHHPHPYHFGYQIKDHHGSHYRKEQGDGHGGVKGSYGYTDDHGIDREVHYVADHQGFRAEIKTNEPGTANQDPANVKIHSHASHHHHHYTHLHPKDHHQKQHHNKDHNDNQQGQSHKHDHPHKPYHQVQNHKHYQPHHRSHKSEQHHKRDHRIHQMYHQNGKQTSS